ncbi:hypothetical protein BBK82_05075 [Lentzea guizhouensis]|uniref:Uncharacterized protein n=1 Tax=Lentzea guizhouensis TaxID=1586287 RepID=A0A1B2HCU4_9PSEU|nr:hypothetical protein [Lentzea guizhouensis]ANZ35545.1 hypothetical protein BBK82_05075 [Lentzea guizhouensis]
MTTTPEQPRAAIVVRVDEVLAGDKAGLLRYSVRERIEAAIEGAAKRWDVDPAAVTVELAPEPPRLVFMPHELTPEKLAEIERRWLAEHARPQLLHHTAETVWMPGEYGGTVGTLDGVTIPAATRPSWWRRALAVVFGIRE